MPNCFQLIDKETGEAVILQELDNTLWMKFTGSVPKINNRWYKNWYNTIGLLLACGKNWDEIREDLVDGEPDPVIDYLEERFTPSSWYELKH